MSNYIVVDGDSLKFDPQFGINTVTPTGSPTISGSGEATIEDKKLCILGDEKKVSVPASYFSAAYPVQGTGKITIVSLGADQQALFATAQTPLIVVGSQFTALFTPEKPASNDKGPDPAPAPSTGSGTFINSQSFVTAG